MEGEGVKRGMETFFGDAKVLNSEFLDCINKNKVGRI